MVHGTCRHVHLTSDTEAPESDTQVPESNIHTPVKCSPEYALGTSPIQELIIVHNIGHERVRHEAASQGNAIQEHQHDDGH